MTLTSVYSVSASSSPPVPFEWRGWNSFTVWKHDVDRFVEELEELAVCPPAITFPEGGYHGNVENPFQWGALAGVADRVYGDRFTPRIGDVLEATEVAPPSVELLRERFAELSSYLAAYPEEVRPAVYGDLGTQLFGNWRARTGFWALYDAWDRFAEAFEFGSRPADPYTWLRRSGDSETTDPHIVAAHYTAEELTDLAGLAFRYSPKNPLFCKRSDRYLDRSDPDLRTGVPGEPASYFRYAVCLSTHGWESWWRTIIGWIARVGFRAAFIDNADAFACRCPTCQHDFRAFLAARYTRAQLDRWFTTSTSLIVDHSFEQGWYQAGEGGPWTSLHAGPLDGLQVRPDIDAVRGLYSARLEGPGRLQLKTVTPDPPVHNYEFTVHYRAPTATVRLEVREDAPGNRVVLNETLPSAATWTAHRTSFRVDAVPLNVVIALDGPGLVWVDELWLSSPDRPGNPTPTPQPRRPDR